MRCFGLGLCRVRAGERRFVGDFRYAGQDRSFQLGELLGTGTRMLLQAKILELQHPRTGERLRIEAPADGDFCRFFSEI